MLASLSLFALALLLLLISCDAALGTHFNCSWRPGEGSPSQLHYLRFCEAGATNIADAAADYDCLLGRSVKPREAPKVADWGKYASGVLEWRGLRGAVSLVAVEHMLTSSHPRNDSQ